MADYDFIKTRNQIIESALRKVGALTLGETVSATQFSQAQAALNSIVKSWQNEGIFLWQVTPLTLNLATDTASYDFPSATPILGIEKARHRASATDDESYVEIISWSQYSDIADKDDGGHPTVIALNFQDSKFYVWPVPEADEFIDYNGYVKLKDWDDADAAGDLPSNFQRALDYQLASDLADEYGLPNAECEKLERKAMMLLYKARTSDRDCADYEYVTGAFKI